MPNMRAILPTASRKSLPAGLSICGASAGRPRSLLKAGAVVGVIAGVDSTGALVVTDDSGVRHTFTAVDNIRQIR